MKWKMDKAEKKRGGKGAERTRRVGGKRGEMKSLEDKKRKR